MKFNKKLLAVILTVILALAMMAVPSLAEKSDYNVALFTMSASGEFWSNVMNGAEAAAQEFGITYTIDGPDTESSFEQQINMVEDAITKGADAICIAVCDSEALIPTLEEAAELGIKIVLFNTNCNYEGETFIATDNFIAGQLGGEALAQASGGAGKYVCLGSAETVEANRARCDGAVDFISQNAPDMELVEVKYCDNDLEKGMAIVNDWITANPDLKAIFSNNDTTTIAVANVLQERGLVGEIVHVGFDASETNVVYLEEGVTSAIITQDAYDIGYQSIVAAVTLLDGGTVEPNIATNVAVVTKDNLNDESIRKILNF